jgi:GNAT superfamily N-acetyltransferase
MAPISIRRAAAEDAAKAVLVLRASITELCVADHQNDPETLARWLRNKTTEHFLRWLANADNFVVVAEQATALCRVESISRHGELNLLYVRPGSQRCGVGRALLLALEEQAQAWALAEIRLRSSAGARAFYARHGYVSAGDPSVAFGAVIDYPYSKALHGDAA